MSDLLKIYLALEDPVLRQRVQGAVVKYAHYRVGQGGDRTPGLALAHEGLASPFSQVQAFVIEVVGNSTVLDQIILGPDGRTPYAQGVPDSDITYVVEATWDAVAERLTLPEAPSSATEPGAA